jgi:hypothetical protein
MLVKISFLKFSLFSREIELTKKGSASTIARGKVVKEIL